MKKLLALLLLSPLASANVWRGATNSLDLENLGRWFPNDSYIGVICTNDYYVQVDIEYRMLTYSIEEDRGINLMLYTHTNNNGYKHNYDDWNRTYHEKLHKNEKWGALYVNDKKISINTPGFTQITKEDFRTWFDIPCRKASKVEMKNFGYKVEKIYQKHQKIIQDNYDKWQKKKEINFEMPNKLPKP